MGFEPTASTLRMCGSQCFDQALSEDFPGVAAFRSPQAPSGSLSIRSRSGDAGTELGVSTNWYSRPIGRLSQCAANGARSPLTTITFLGEQQDITDPEAAVLA